MARRSARGYAAYIHYGRAVSVSRRDFDRLPNLGKDIAFGNTAGITFKDGSTQCR
jgi:hypothetical protein